MRRGTDGAAGTPPRTEGYTVVDALLGYAVNDNFKLRANAYNLFDKAYVAAINKSGYRYVPGRSQTLLFRADFGFSVRSDERRGGQEGVSTFRSGGSPYH